jgi:AraC family transcriptional activator of pobA
MLQSNRAGPSLVTQFFLYGEQPKSAGDRFAHLEPLAARSRPANWIIQPHSHRDLHHVFLFLRGGGIVHADERTIDCRPPCILIVPAGVVHSFRFERNSVGTVLTFSDPLLRLASSRYPDIATAFERALCVPAFVNKQLDAALKELELELGWAAPAHEFAVESLLSTILIWVHRLHHCAQQKAQTAVGPRAMLVARYRALVEKRFREHPSMKESAQAMGVAPARLRNACKSLTGAPPGEILKARLNLEAQRLMRYSNLSIGQIALQLGFEDPAYFSRFFTKMSGSSPRAFRAKMHLEAQKAGI